MTFSELEHDYLIDITREQVVVNVISLLRTIESCEDVIKARIEDYRYDNNDYAIKRIIGTVFLMASTDWKNIKVNDYLFKVSYSGLDNLNKYDQYLICPNHSCVFDPFFIYPPSRNLFIMAKAERH